MGEIGGVGGVVVVLVCGGEVEGVWSGNGVARPGVGVAVCVCRWWGGGRAPLLGCVAIRGSPRWGCGVVVGRVCASGAARTRWWPAAAGDAWCDGGAVLAPAAA